MTLGCFGKLICIALLRRERAAGLHSSELRWLELLIRLHSHRVLGAQQRQQRQGLHCYVPQGFQVKPSPSFSVIPAVCAVRVTSFSGVTDRFWDAPARWTPAAMPTLRVFLKRTLLGSHASPLPPLSQEISYTWHLFKLYTSPHTANMFPMGWFKNRESWGKLPL